jgi:cell division protein FtsQ
MGMWRKILNISAWVILAAYLGVSLWFTGNQMRQQTFRSLRVVVADSLDARFIRSGDVTGILGSQGIRILGSPVGQLNRDQVMNMVKTVAGVKDALVYSTPDGTLFITVWQRKPLMRFIGPFESFYIDTDGREMPLSPRYSAQVMVVTGTPDRKLLSDSLYRMVDYISREPFLNSLISEIQVYPDHTLEIIPRIGDNRIFMGDACDYEWKLTKLRAFYQQGLPNVGWDKYSRVDLGYSNQVVARLWDKKQRAERDSLRFVRDTTGEGERMKEKGESNGIKIEE